MTQHSSQPHPRPTFGRPGAEEGGALVLGEACIPALSLALLPTHSVLNRRLAQGPSTRHTPAPRHSLLRRALVLPGDAISLSEAICSSLVPALSHVPLSYPPICTAPTRPGDAKTGRCRHRHYRCSVPVGWTPSCFSGSPTQPASVRGRPAAGPRPPRRGTSSALGGRAPRELPWLSP